MKNVLKFRTPKNTREATERFNVLEERGDRVLVEEIEVCKKLEIKPSFVYLRSWLIEAEAN